MARIQEVERKLVETNKSNKEAAVVHRRIQVFKESDVVWVHLNEQRSAAGTYNKLKENNIALYQILKRNNDNAYKIEIPAHIYPYPTFNVMIWSLSMEKMILPQKRSLSHQGRTLAFQEDP